MSFDFIAQEQEDTGLLSSNSLQQCKTFELSPLGAFFIQKYGFLFQIPSTLELAKGTLCNDPSKEINYVYEFSMNQCPMHFGLFRTQNSLFINLRVRLLSKLESDETGVMMDDIYRSVMRASIVDDTGNYVQAEKIAYGTKTRHCEGDFTFEFVLLNFISILELQSSILINTNGSLNINIQFQSKSYEFPESVMCQRFGYESSDKPLTHPKYYGIFHQLVRDQGFSSLLKIELMKPMFTNVTLKIIMDENIVEKISAHAVMLSAFSSKFAELLQKSNEITFNGWKPGIIKLMLDFIYGGTLHTTDLDNLIQLIKIADEYRIIGLRNACVMDIYDIFGIPSGLRNITSCFKLGQLIKSKALIDKAIENLIWLIEKHPEKYNSELDKIEANYAEVVDDLMKMEELIGSNVPIEKEIKKSLPSSEVKVLGSFTESFHGILFIIPRSICSEFLSDLENDGNHLDQGKVYFSQLMDIQKENSDNKESMIEIFYKKQSKLPSIHLRLLTKSTDNPSKDFLEQAISKTQLKLSVFDEFGRIAIESSCSSFSDGTNKLIWEISPFLILEQIQRKQLINEDGEILFRIGLFSSQNYPTLNQITSLEEKQSYEKYNNEFFRQINRDQYQIRLFTQLQSKQDCSRPTDATVYLVDNNKNKLADFRVDQVIVSAFSNVLRQHFLQTTHIGLPIENYSIETVRGLLDYCYGGPIIFDSFDRGLELLCGAQELEMSGVVCLCLDTMLNFPNVNFQHGILMFKIGIGIKSIALKNKAILYFQRNLNKIKFNSKFQQFLEEFKELKEFLENS